jgi:hypothetical protein
VGVGVGVDIGMVEPKYKQPKQKLLSKYLPFPHICLRSSLPTISISILLGFQTASIQEGVSI